MKRTPAIDRSATIKANIRTAAGRLFADRGYAATGIREIAEAAGVDKSIVIRHFGSKENLFIETVSLPFEWTAMMESPLIELPDRLIRLIGTGRDGVGKGVFVAMVRASDSEEVRGHLRAGLEEMIAEPLARRIDADNARLRAHLFAAAVVGLLTMSWALDDSVISESDPDTLALTYAPALRALLVGNEGTRRQSSRS